MTIFRTGRPASQEPSGHAMNKVLPVLSAEDLLHSKGHQALIEQVERLSGLSSRDFDQLYRRFIHNFAEMVQVVPRKRYSLVSGLLNLGLLRGVNALNYLVNHSEDEAADTLERYALFTAATLYEVSLLLSRQAIHITEKGGKYLSTWTFAQGSLYSQGASYYKLKPYKKNYYALRDPITVLLAEEIMPREGYEWIAAHWSVYTEWLSALCQRGEGEQRFEYILGVIRTEDDYWLIPNLPDIEVDYEEPHDILLAEEFFKWLEEEIEKGNLREEGVEPDLYAFSDGVFIDSRVIDRFSKLYNSPMTVVFFQIGNALGIAKQSGEDHRFDQFFTKTGSLLKSSKTLVKGLFVSDKFIKTKASIKPGIKLEGSAPSRDFESNNHTASMDWKKKE